MQMKLNNYHFNDDVVRGLFDADGCFYASFYKRKKKNGTTSVTLNWTLQLELASFNKETVEGFLNYLGANKKASIRVRKSGRSIGCSSCRIVLSPKNLAFKRLINIYKKTPPLVNNRLEQFLVFEKLYFNYQTKGRWKTNEERALMLFLCLKITKNTKRKANVASMLQIQKFSKNELKAAQIKANIYWKEIQNEIKALSNSLPNTKLSNDYMIGFTYGDGSFLISYNHTSTNRIAFRPQWNISEPFIPLLESFKYTIGRGNLSKASNSLVLCQYTLTNIKNCFNFVLPIFDNILMPPYKQNQYERFKKAVKLLIHKKVYKNFNNYKKFIMLTYKMSSRNRKLTKQYYLKLGKKYFSKRLKRKR